MKTIGKLFLIAVMSRAAPCVAQTAHADGQPYTVQAGEVMQYIEQKYYIDSSGLYRHSLNKDEPEFMWGNGIMFSALVGASRYEPNIYLPTLSRYFKAMDAYWDSKAAVPGYEPAPTSGNGHDKYYDDNQWMVLTLTEAFELTHDQQYLNRAQAALRFSMSGWDEQLGGGILWHETAKGQSKNTCSNAPAAAACLRIAKFLSPSQTKQAIAMAAKIVKWTDIHFESADGLYADSEQIIDKKLNSAKLTYNTALMIRSDLGLYRWTGDQKYLDQAERSAKASDWFLNKKTGAYRDSIKWSHLLVEADLEMYRKSHENYLIDRARKNALHAYADWKTNPPDTLIDNASLARLLWLMADAESDTGKKFWQRADQITQ